MKTKVELPIVEPVYGTYHFQGDGSAIIKDNPSIRNWYLNFVSILSCSRDFLNGYNSPDLSITHSSVEQNPYIESIVIPIRYLGGYVSYLIKNLLNNGYYVEFRGVDDYYVKGKSWYHKKHFNHDGLICGYDQDDKTYSIYSYDENWIYRVFKTPQICFDRGLKAMLKEGFESYICALKPKDDVVEINLENIYRRICEYLASNLKIYPPDTEGMVYGIAAQDYIAMYIDRINDGFIKHADVDRRVFRMIWEHKKIMLERIVAVENILKLTSDISERYEPLVREADNMRMLYASYCLRERQSLLSTIKDKLLKISKKEYEILTDFKEKMEEYEELWNCGTL